MVWQGGSWGNRQVSWELAQLYMGGKGVAQDFEEAFPYLQLAAQAQNPYVLGQMYWKGLGVSFDKEKRRYWLRRTARNNKAAHALLERA